jgi:hypothetical protein
MNGYLQRIALSATKPADSIQPVLGSVFGPSNNASGFEASSVGATLLVARPEPSESELRVDSRASLNHHGRSAALEAYEPSPEGQQPAGLGEAPISTSNRLFTRLVHPSRDGEERLTGPRTPGKNRDQYQEGSGQLPGERREEQPLTKTNEVQTVEMLPAKPAKLANPSTSTSNRSSLSPWSAEKAKAPALELFAEPGGEQNPEGALDTRRKTTVGQAGKQQGEDQMRQIADETAMSRGADRAGTQLAATTAIANTDLRGFVASTPAPFRSQAEVKERAAPLRRRTEHPPDEIQIHIGRIEVIAVPPAQTPPAPQKPRRGSPSLDEYLRRRGGKSL